MARVNKVSLREEFDSFKAQFRHLSDTGKMTDEGRVLIQGMITLFEVLLAERDLRMSKVKQKVSEHACTPKPTAVSPAICRPWLIRATIHWWRFSWPSLVK